MRTFAIVGAGAAGASAAEALRGAGFDGRIVLFGEESEYPYQRPPLSKEVLREADVAQDRIFLRTADFYAHSSIEVRRGERVVNVDPAARVLETQRGARLEYDELLIATGGVPRRLDVPGAELAGIRYLRTLSDALAIRKEFERRPRVLVVGGGFIGCEVAASARQTGCEVTIAGPSLPMAHALGDEVGAIYAGYHHDRGVRLKAGVTVTAFRGAGSLEAALLSDATSVACDLAIVGIGILPSIPRLAGLETHDGIVTDEFCRTNVEHVFAAGDVANSWRPRLGRRIRLEHFDNAELQGTAAALPMCGTLKAYDPIPFFWSDQYDLDLQYYGNAPAWEEVVLRGRPAEGSFSAFYRTGARIEAVCSVNRSRDASALKRLLGQAGIASASLADDSVALKDLVRMGTS